MFIGFEVFGIAQNNAQKVSGNISVSSEEGKIKLHSNEKGALHVNSKRY